jgi:hypothetical protein
MTIKLEHNSKENTNATKKKPTTNSKNNINYKRNTTPNMLFDNQ